MIMKSSNKSIFCGCLIAICVIAQSSALPSSNSCSNTFSGPKNRTILSPGYPNNYANGEFCNYAIQLPPGETVKMTFRNASLEHFEEQIVDYVLLFDGKDCMSKRIAAVVNSSIPTYVSSGNQMTALFISDITIPKGPFEAQFSKVTNETATKPVPPFPGNKIMENCGQELSDDSGIISYHASGGYNHLCIWRITVEGKKRIQISFDTIQIASLGDWIRVLDGSDCGADVMYYIGGQETNWPPTLTSTSNAMIIVFSSSSGSLTDVIEATYSSVSESRTNSVSVGRVLSEAHGKFHCTPCPYVNVPPAR
ncbi:unnamed protein product [Dicrocoelium dendriticum]|nr:unnamed protein product [Dicrocoelium dendriticum]